MTLSFTVGGTRGTFEPDYAAEVAEVLEHAFGAEVEWEGTAPVHYGEQADFGWGELQDRACAELGREAIPILLAITAIQGGVYLPAQLRAVTLSLPTGAPLNCASLQGLRDELAHLASLWDLPLDDAGLGSLLSVGSDPDDGFVADPPEIFYLR